MAEEGSRYDAIIESIFFDHYREGESEFEFARSELESIAQTFSDDRSRNLGDVLYTFRFRKALPESIIATQPGGMEWVIELAGKGKYRFKLTKVNRVVPRNDLIAIDIPDATPELIRAYKLDDEQALLAIVRYNRLIDTFLGLTTYSLQNHLRTAVRGVGQIEIDELYVGIDKRGRHYVIPVQAKGGHDRIGTVQAAQDIRFVQERFAGMRCRAIAAQFMDEEIVALFELTEQGGEIKVVEERHYRLVPANELNAEAIRDYS